MLRSRLAMLAAVRRLVTNVGGLLLGANLALTAYHCALLRDQAGRVARAAAAGHAAAVASRGGAVAAVAATALPTSASAAALYPEQRLRFGFDRAGALVLVEPSRELPKPLSEGECAECRQRVCIGLGMDKKKPCYSPRLMDIMYVSYGPRQSCTSHVACAIYRTVCMFPWSCLGVAGTWAPGLPTPPVPRSLPLWCGLHVPLCGERAAVSVHGCREVMGLQHVTALLTDASMWKVRGRRRGDDWGRSSVGLDKG